ncbi:MAG TPA: FadR/GntR family transcriptional regulator [Anaerolineales bacterium]|nr:FadR/GntR family transcriptional regulator [Anaerolineales bacterium]
MSPPYTPIQLERMYEQIVAQIEEQIVSGVLIVGDKLPPERELAEQFQVSRTAVREAVKALQERGLVEVHPGRGTFITNAISKATRESLGLMMRITSNSRQGFSELFELREKLEPEMAALAALRATDEEIAAMIKAVETMDASMKDMDAYIAADNLFHQAIARATQNSLFATVLDPIIDLLIEQRKSNFLAGVQSPQRAQRYHKDILDAILQRNPDGAKEAMKSHLEQVIFDIK